MNADFQISYPKPHTALNCSYTFSSYHIDYIVQFFFVFPSCLIALNLFIFLYYVVLFIAVSEARNHTDFVLFKEF